MLHRVCTLWKLRKFTLTEKIFRQITYLVISLVKLLLSRNFCQKCVRVNFRNFHTVSNIPFFREINSVGSTFLISRKKNCICFRFHFLFQTGCLFKKVSRSIMDDLPPLFLVKNLGFNSTQEEFCHCQHMWGFFQFHEKKNSIDFEMKVW